MSHRAKEKLHDRICYTILKAPDHFPIDTGMTLEKSFLQMHADLAEAFLPTEEACNSIGVLLDRSYASYQSANQKEAIKLLQIIESYLSGRIGQLPVVDLGK